MTAPPAPASPEDLRRWRRYLAEERAEAQTYRSLAARRTGEEQGQDEFYFSLPYAKMDLCLYAYNEKVRPAEVAPVLGLTPDQVERVFRDIEAKRRATRYLHTPPLLVEPVEGPGPVEVPAVSR